MPTRSIPIRTYAPGSYRLPATGGLDVTTFRSIVVDTDVQSVGDWPASGSVLVQLWVGNLPVPVHSQLVPGPQNPGDATDIVGISLSGGYTGLAYLTFIVAGGLRTPVVVTAE